MALIHESRLRRNPGQAEALNPSDLRRQLTGNIDGLLRIDPDEDTVIVGTTDRIVFTPQQITDWFTDSPIILPEFLRDASLKMKVRFDIHASGDPLVRRIQQLTRGIVSRGVELEVLRPEGTNRYNLKITKRRATLTPTLTYLDFSDPFIAGRLDDLESPRNANMDQLALFNELVLLAGYKDRNEDRLQPRPLKT